MTPARTRRAATAGLLLLSLAACTESDELLVEQVGVVRLYLIHTGLLRQSVNDAFERIQVAEWEVEEATVNIDGASLPFVVPTAPCSFTDTVLVSPLASGPCSSGIVIESSNQPFQVFLSLKLGSMRAQRAEPPAPDRLPSPGLPIPAGFDGDGDGVPFVQDNCPLLSNGDQADDNGDGIGNACTALSILGPALDSDGDNITDDSDNCVWNTNPTQGDTAGPGVPDGIGDACDPAHVAEVTIVNEQALEAIGPAMLLQPLGTTTFLTVDFDEALDCDPETFSCTLDAGAVQLCTHASLFEAVGGC